MSEGKILTRVRCQGKTYVYLNDKLLTPNGCEFHDCSTFAIYHLGYRWEDVNPDLPTYDNEITEVTEFEVKGRSGFTNPTRLVMPETLTELKDRHARWQARLRREKIERMAAQLAELRREEEEYIASHRLDASDTEAVHVPRHGA